MLLEGVSRQVEQSQRESKGKGEGRDFFRFQERKNRKRKVQSLQDLFDSLQSLLRNMRIHHCNAVDCLSPSPFALRRMNRWPMLHDRTSRLAYALALLVRTSSTFNQRVLLLSSRMRRLAVSCGEIPTTYHSQMRFGLPKTKPAGIMQCSLVILFVHILPDLPRRPYYKLCPGQPLHT